MINKINKLISKTYKILMRILCFFVPNKNLRRKIRNNSYGNVDINYMFSKKYTFNKDAKHCFYLKVNRNVEYCFTCLQNWIDIVKEIGGDFIIICDKYSLMSEIYQKVNFYDYSPKFMKSYKKPFKKFINKIADNRWEKAACAHLSTFYHAKINNITSFWNIDADDTMFLIEPKKLALILNDISKYANDHDISNFSLDMHYTKFANEHWSFGVTYTRMNIDYFDIINKEDISWVKKMKDNYSTFRFSNVRNLDWFFTYCRFFRNMKNETYYIENSQFIHYTQNFLLQPFNFWGAIYHWRNGFLEHPIFSKILYNKEFSSYKINENNTIKFDYDLKDSDYIGYLNYRLIYFDKNNIKIHKKIFIGRKRLD